MAFSKPTSPVKSSTQAFLEIADVVDDVLMLKDSSCVCVIEIGAVNFYLLSTEEQQSMVYAYANLLNSLSFPVQILILSKRMDISNYIEYVEGKIRDQQSQLIRTRLNSYEEFIKAVVKKNTVLEKRFFFVVPFNPLEMGATGAGAKGYSRQYILTRAKTALYPKRDHLLRLLAKIGVRASVMGAQEITELYYNLYNPSSVGRQLGPVGSYYDTVMSG